MSLQQQAAASGATAGNTSDTPLSPSNPSESKRRRTSEGDAEADAAMDLEEAIRRSLEDADAGGSVANHSAGGPSTAAGGPSTAAGGPSTAANPFAAFFGPSGAGAGTASGTAPRRFVKLPGDRRRRARPRVRRRRGGRHPELDAPREPALPPPNRSPPLVATRGVRARRESDERRRRSIAAVPRGG